VAEFCKEYWMINHVEGGEMMGVVTMTEKGGQFLRGKIG